LNTAALQGSRALAYLINGDDPLKKERAFSQKTRIGQWTFDKDYDADSETARGAVGELFGGQKPH